MPRREDEHGRVAGELELLFAGEPALEEPLAVRAHLRGCPVCARRFEELAALDRVLIVDEEDAQDSFEARYTASVVAALAQQAAAPPPRPSAWDALVALLGGPRLGWGLAAAGLALAALAALIASTARAPEPLKEQERFAARGASGALDRGVRRFEMFCVAPAAGGGARFAEADPSGRLRCAAGDELKFAVLNAGPEGEVPLDHLALLGVDAGGAVRWFQPVPAARPEVASVAVGASPRLRPLGETLRLTGASGVVRVYGVFTAGALERAALEERVRAQARPGGAPGTLDLDGLTAARADGAATLGDDDAGRYVVTSRVLEIAAPETP